MAMKAKVCTTFIVKQGPSKKKNKTGMILVIRAFWMAQKLGFTKNFQFNKAYLLSFLTTVRIIIPADIYWYRIQVPRQMLRMKVLPQPIILLLNAPRNWFSVHFFLKIRQMKIAFIAPTLIY